ncbi:MAG: 4-phosphoerythronate dehydrogenase [Bacteroidales bacterium]
MIKRKLKIVVDSVIPFLKGVLEPYADVLYKDGKLITHEDVIDADALIIRTRTKCDEKFLRKTRIKIISTATIGTDHIDLDFCQAHSIKVCNAAGCNAGGVMDYVFSALYGTACREAIKLKGCKFGIIGVGNVGSKVAYMADYLGFNVLKNDPPREEKEGPEGFCSLDYLLKNADIVTLHVPLDETTKGMADDLFFDNMKPGAFFINASRGEVMSDEALLRAIPKLGPVIIDTWNNEPNVNQELISKVDIATPHIAGYSFQGKQNGTSGAVRSVAKYFGITELYDYFPYENIPQQEPMKLSLKGMNQGEIAAVMQYNYPIFTDDFMFRLNPDGFETMRSEYQYRREFYV